MKRFLTVFLPTQNVHLYKDVGMIPYCLARFCGYQCGVAYVGDKIKQDSFYEKHVALLHINNSSNVFKKIINIFKFIYKNADKYDIINFYHLSLKNFILPLLFKLLNPKCKIYLKLDLNEAGYLNLKNIEKKCKRALINYFKAAFLKYCVDIVSVESKKYYHDLRKIDILTNKLIYLPNGVLIDNDALTQVTKENIILAVGRIGIKEKNNELLVNAIAKIPPKKIKQWKVFFVGPVEESFKKFVEKVVAEKDWLQDIFILVGNIEDKNKLYSYYARSKIFCQTSFSESFGLAILEAMFFKNYIISTQYETVNDLLDSGRKGKIIENNNIKALRENLEECVDGKIDMFSYGETACNYARNHFDWGKIILSLDQKIQQLD